ncbi:MAG TPA: hypothetical protein VLF61_00210 [Rhabdochlamydiaceae bacterium]|nr:hypothetical protein [Rhabdochlamydiaceae bacterium]
MVFALMVSLLFFKERVPSYPKIKDLYHPTIKDVRALHYYLKKGKRAAVENLKDFKGRARIKLIGKANFPKQGIIAVNCDEKDKENCLILYATYNKNYPEGLKHLIDHIVKSDYRGHILYRIGGWPNCEAGDFSLAGVPYAFKVCFFKEAERLGYKRCLWLDSSIIPLKSLNALFAIIEKKGYLAMGNRFMVASFFNEASAKFFKLSMEEIAHIPSCSSGIFGLDFSHAKARQALELWYSAAQDPTAFFSARPDQNSLSLILYLCDMRHWLDIETLAHSKEQICSDSLFLLDRDFVQNLPKSQCPKW